MNCEEKSTEVQEWSQRKLFLPVFILFKLLLLLFYSYCVYEVCRGAHAIVLFELVLSFHHKGPKDSTHVVRFGGKFLYLLSHLASP